MGTNVSSCCKSDASNKQAHVEYDNAISDGLKPSQRSVTLPNKTTTKAKHGSSKFDVKKNVVTTMMDEINKETTGNFSDF